MTEAERAALEAVLAVVSAQIPTLPRTSCLRRAFLSDRRALVVALGRSPVRLVEAERADYACATDPLPICAISDGLSPSAPA
jgi:hypothetical protein